MSQPIGEELVAAVKALAVAHDLRRQAFEVCHGRIERATADELRGWPREQITPHFRSIAVVCEHGRLDYPYLDTRLDLCVRDDSGVRFDGRRTIGYYRLITLLDGTAEDDYFVIDTDSP